MIQAEGTAGARALSREGPRRLLRNWETCACAVGIVGKEERAAGASHAVHFGLREEFGRGHEGDGVMLEGANHVYIFRGYNNDNDNSMVDDIKGNTDNCFGCGNGEVIKQKVLIS